MDGRAISQGGSYNWRPDLEDAPRDECGRCALEAQHPPEPCAYVCGDCNGSGVDCDRDGCVDGLIHDNGWDEEVE